MIESIKIKSIATYPDVEEAMDGLAQLNYVYGANGSGKTTLSRVVAEADQFLGRASIKWRSDRQLKTLVYNVDFVERNLRQSDRVKGVFTLGTDAAEAVDKIRELKGKEIVLQAKRDQKQKALFGDSPNEVGGKQQEYDSLNEVFVETCWRQKLAHEDSFKAAFAGFIGKKQNFKDKVLNENRDNKSILQSFNPSIISRGKPGSFLALNQRSEPCRQIP